MLNDHIAQTIGAVKETFLITVDEQPDEDMKDTVSAFRLASMPSY